MGRDRPPRLRGAVLGTLLAALAALALPAGAAAQATRTWISGVGDDANPCSRTAPCKTWAGAISKTAVGGEIDALDPGGFGAVTITKSITLNGAGTNASILGSSGAFGIAVNGSGIHVVINDLSLDGAGAGTNAIQVSSAASVRVQHTDIEGWTRSAIDDESSAAMTVVDVDNTTITNNSGDGVVLAPAAGLGGSVTLANDAISSNACGVVATSFGMPASPSFTTNCGANASGSPSGTAKVSVANSSVSNNAGAGVLANGSPAIDYISHDAITGNGTGLQELAGGQIIAVGTNTVLGNGTNGSPTSTQSAAPEASDVELISCKAVKKKKAQNCTGRLVASSSVKARKHGRRAHAILSRNGKVYAVGTIMLGSARSEAVLSLRRHLKARRYRLTIKRNGRVIGTRTVVVS